MENRILVFDVQSSVGVISTRTHGSRENWHVLAEAIGCVSIPFDQEVRLVVHQLAVFDPRLFANLDENSLSVFEWVSTRKATDEAIQYVAHLTGLRGLALWETKIGDEALRYVKQLVNLRWLDVGSTRITDQGLSYLCGLEFLDYLTLVGDEITDAGLAQIAKLPRLTGLDLMNTSVSDGGVKILCDIASLRYLRVFKTRITERGYAELKGALIDCEIKYHHPHHEKARP